MHAEQTLFEKAAEVKAELLSRINSCLSYLLPNGTFRNVVFYVGNIRGDNGKSLVVETRGEKQDYGVTLRLKIKVTSSIFGRLNMENAKTEFPKVINSIGEWLGRQHPKGKRSIKELERYLTCS